METGNSKNKTFDTPEINAITGQNGVIPAEQVTSENRVTIPEINLSETAPLAEKALADAKAQTQEQTKLEELTAQRIADQQKQFAEQRAMADLISTQGQEFQSTFNQKMEEIKPIEQEVSRLNKQIARETAALESQLINEEGRRIERGFISGRSAIIEQRGVARINALSGLLDAKNGDLENAQNKIAMSMTMLEKANSAEIDSKRASIELLREITGVSQADEEKELERLEKEQEKFEKERDDISNIALQAMQAGAGANEIQSIINAKSKDEAIAAASSLGRIARIDAAIKSAQLDNIRAEQIESLPTEDKENVVTKINFVRDTIKQAKDVANAAGRSGFRRGFESSFVGATDYTRLEAFTDTIKTNVLSMVGDPDVKKFFGPQMTEADVRLMTSVETALNAENLSPEDMNRELVRLDKVFAKLDPDYEQKEAFWSAVESQVNEKTLYGNYDLE